MQCYTHLLHYEIAPYDLLYVFLVTSDGRIEPLQMVGVYSFLVGGIIMSVFLMIGENWWKKKVEERAARVRARFMQ